MRNKKLLFRYISGNITNEEKARIIRWLDASPENMRQFLILRKLYDITLWQDSTTANMKITNGTRITGVQKLIVKLSKIAAVFLLISVSIYYLLYINQEPEIISVQTIHVPAGQHVELTLTDGTKVWLNAKTTFTFPERFSSKSREVKLDGEGYFDVVRNENKPFVVETKNYRIKVLGTEFNVLSYSSNGNFETSLFRGSVELLKPGEPQGMVLNPNEMAYLHDGQLERGLVTNFSQFLWKDGIISFNNESFATIVQKLQNYFDVQIIVKNKITLDYSCTGKFRISDGVEHILKVIQLNADFQYVIDNEAKTIIIE